ncbi:MAG: anthranilate synthase component I family protein [Thermoplasmata archaeon]
MNDPWATFAERAAGSECAGYFERAAGHAGPRGQAVWFDRGECLPSVTPRSGLGPTRRAVEAHLARGRGVAAMGYLGFDAVGLMEPALRAFPAGAPFPCAEFVLASDPRLVDLPLRRTRSRAPVDRSPGPPLSDTLPRSRFCRSVNRLRAAIREGEAFQVVLAHRRAWRRPGDLLERAGRLRDAERYAYFYYLRTGDREILGASPESVVELVGATARVNPIAGTLPHAAGPGRLPLPQDPKELSEHRMLVDLARNDLGRVARAGSVRVLWKERRVRYAQLEHLVSRVGAQLRPGLGPWDALAATFPAGTVSGAPKIRAVELLRREERTWRGPYGGSVGLLRPGGRADWALTIRSAFAAGARLYTAAGAGIVHGSDGDREFDETLTKLGQLEASLLGGGT